MPQPEGDVPLANLVATSGGHTDPDQNAAPISKEEQATPTAAPGTRQLRHTRSQSARKAPAALGSTDAKANQAVEGEEPEGATKQDQLVESQQESAVAAATEPDAAVHDTSAAMAGVDKDQPAASVKHSKSTEAVGPTAEPEESDITDNAPSGRGRGGRGRGRGARGRGKGRTKSKGRAKAAGNTSPKAPSEDQADFANELDSPSRNASDAAEQCIQLDPSREDVSISELSEGDHQQASQAAKGNSQLYKGKSDASQASGPHAGLKSQTSKADNLTVTQPDDLEMSELVEPKTSQLDESRASRREEPRTSGLEPPAKRPRRAAANAGQKEPKEVNNGKAKEGTDGKAKQVNTGKAKARGAQARRGVVQESDTDGTDDIDIVDQEEDVDIGTNDEPYEQSPPAEDMEVDDKPLAQAGKKRPRKPEELPSSKGRPKPGPNTAKGPALGAAKAGKGSAEGSGPVAKTGKGSSVAPVPTRAGPKEKRPGSGKHEASQAATNSSPGDIAKQAAEVQKVVLKDAMKGFDDARQAIEDARQALAQAADQVETSLNAIGQLSGLTMDILRDTLLGKEVSKLNKLARLHPTITDCERISSKASEVTAILKRAVGLPTQGPGQQPQGQSQQPKKPAPKADSRLTSPASPIVARTASAAAPALAPAVASAPVAAAAAPSLPDQMPGVSSGPEKMGESGPQQATGNVAAKQQPSDVKVEATPQASSPANRPVAGAAQAGAGPAPGNAQKLRADPHPALDASQPAPASSQQQLKPAGKLPLAKAQHALSSAAGTAGQPHGDSVRGKAVAILGLALTSPTDLTPQEAAVALEAAVFAQFAEHGEPGMRYKRRLHALWSYLRGTDQAPAVSQLRQKVLQGEILAKTLAKIDRAQAQHLCSLKLNGTQRPLPQHAQQAQAQHQQPFPQLQATQQPLQQLPSQQQQPPLYASQQQQKPHQGQDPVAAVQPQQKLHPWQQASTAAPLPYSTPNAYSYEAASMYQQPWHHPHQQPYAVAAPVVLPTQQMPHPGATLPLAQAQAATAAPPPPPSSSGEMAAAPPPPTGDPPEPPAAPPLPQSSSSSLPQGAASQPPGGTSKFASSSAMPRPEPASVAAPHASLAPGMPVIDPSAGALSATATTRSLNNQAGAASQALLEAGLRRETNLDASASMRQQNHGPSAQAAPVWLPSKGLNVRDSPASFSKIDNDFGSDSERPPGVDDESTMSDAMDRQRSVVIARSVNAAGVEAPPKIEVIKKDTIEVLKDFTAFDLDQYVAGGSKSWTFWNCEPSTFPWEYGSVEHAYILQGKFSVQYEGAEPVTIEAGDFVKFPVGMTTFVVMEPTRKFFNLA
ncbi:hypothetical protein WJX77_006587 [Trebouxia sp. C0004]